MEETSGTAADGGSFFQSGQICNRCCVYRTEQHLHSRESEWQYYRKYTWVILQDVEEHIIIFLWCGQIKPGCEFSLVKVSDLCHCPCKTAGTWACCISYCLSVILMLTCFCSQVWGPWHGHHWPVGSYQGNMMAGCLPTLGPLWR